MKEKDQYVYNTVPKDVSILRESMIKRFMTMQNSLGNTSNDIEKGDGSIGESHSLALRSSVDNNLWYEFVRVIPSKLSTGSEIFIYVCMSEAGKDIPRRMFCCYANGDVLVWGLWFAELLHTFPVLYEQCSQLYNKKLIRHYNDRGLLPKLDTELPHAFRDIEGIMRNSNFFSKEAISSHYDNAKIRII